NVFDPRVIRWRLDGPGREQQLLSLGEVRRGIEPVAAELAAAHATPEQCGVLVGAVVQMAVHAKSGDLEAYLRADRLFHATLLAASGNEMLAALGDLMVVSPSTHSTPTAATVRLHGDVAEAVQSGDPVGAAAVASQLDSCCGALDTPR
ncbi:FadR/GntR family transcriptional regulator, partial [Terrabacter sp. 2RAF25]|uniref:FadR/GntR family transcriptional regulator n=1 Tax=Terrabacter sp. 2RAF25 TaxID=3232998 RepID=UPI003F99E867